MPVTATDKSNQILKEIINNSWSGIGIIDKNSKFIYVNEAFKPILGYTEEELLQMNFQTLLLPKYQEDFKNLLLKNIESEYTNNILVGCKRKDNQFVYLDVSIKLISDKKFIVININDVTKNISDHETFDKYVIQLHIDTEGIINKVSEAFCRLTLFQSEELLNKSYEMLFYKDLNEQDLELRVINDVETQGQFTGIVASRNKHNEIFWVDIIIKPIKNKYGDITGYSAVMFDITSEINLKKNKLQLEETIVDNNTKLRIMSDTMKTVAHQWRQPLNNISLEAQNLLLSYDFLDEPMAKEEAVPVLESMQTNVQKLSNIISKFQYVTEFNGNKVDVDIKDIIKKSIALSIADEKNITINIDQNIVVNVYDELLIQVIASILDNAQEALEKRLNIEKKIEFNVIIEKNYIYLKISNNGGNIADNLLEEIFAPYFSTKQEKNGVGLSLYISKMIAQFHLKGDIKVINHRDDVVEFDIIFPIKGKHK